MQYIVILFLVGIQQTAAKTIKSIKISGLIKESKSTENMILCYWSDYVCSSRDGFIGRKVLKSKIINDHFKFELSPTSSLIYFSLGNSYGSMTNLLIPFAKMYVAEIGDSLSFKIGKDGIESINGKGAFKYKLKKVLDSITEKQVAIFEYFSKFGNLFKIEKGRLTYDSIFKQQMKLLFLKRKHISANAFQFFVTDLISSNVYDKLRYIYHLDRNTLNSIDLYKEIVKDSIYATAFLAKNGIVSPWNNSKLVVFSINAVNYLVLKAIVLSKVLSENKDPSKIILANYKDSLREKLLANYFLSDYGWMYGDLQKEKNISDAMPYIKNKNYVILLDNNFNVFSRVNKAFNFTLLDKTGKKYQLSDFKGRIILLDFWFTGCEGCIDFYEKILSKLERRYKDSDSIIFISISPDMETEKWVKSVNKGIYTSSDIKNILNLHSKLGWKDNVFKYYNINSMPNQILIDKNGYIIRNKFNRKIEDFIVAIDSIYQ